MKLCKNCKWYKKKWWEKIPHCYRAYKNAKTIVEENPVTGEVTSYVCASRVQCEEERGSHFHSSIHCGLSGNFWEAKVGD